MATVAALRLQPRTSNGPFYRQRQSQEIPFTQQITVQKSQPSRFRSMRQVPALEQTCNPIVLRYEKHQDTLLVNSVEIEDNRRQLIGVKHYLHMLRRLGLEAKPSLDHTDYRNLAEYHDASENDPSPHIPQSISTTLAPPTPPPSPSVYNYPIYSGNTKNPAIFLSIVRIAQHNLPSINLTSALNHIPNIHPLDTLPTLHTSAPENLAPLPFLDCTFAPKRPNDTTINIAFLPHFYSGTQHSIGYFHLLTSSHGNKKVGTCLFTPCTEEDLKRYGLVEYLKGREDEGSRGMRRVGSGHGCWVDKDTVEEYREWSLVWKIVGGVWEGRLGYSRGELEG